MTTEVTNPAVEMENCYASACGGSELSDMGRAVLESMLPSTEQGRFTAMVNAQSPSQGAGRFV